MGYHTRLSLVFFPWNTFLPFTHLFTRLFLGSLGKPSLTSQLWGKCTLDLSAEQLLFLQLCLTRCLLSRLPPPLDSKGKGLIMFVEAVLARNTLLLKNMSPTCKFLTTLIHNYHTFFTHRHRNKDVTPQICPHALWPRASSITTHSLTVTRLSYVQVPLQVSFSSIAALYFFFF